MTDPRTYILTISNPETGYFTMPSGFHSNVEVYAWGAGGGGGSSSSWGPGGLGGGGGYAASTLTINAGDHVEFVVGTSGASGAYGDESSVPIGGQGEAVGGRFSGGNGGGGIAADDGDYDGPYNGGGGGSATAIILNGNVAVVAAGGAGGGGCPDDGGLAPATSGLPGGIQAQPSGWYPVTLSWAWCSFMNNYAIWTGGFYDVTTNVYNTIVNFPTTDTYTFYLSTDNYGSISVDSTSILSYSDFTTVGSTTHSIAAGNHTVTLSITNTGGPSGVAARILNSSGVEIWNSRYPENFPELNSNSRGGDAGPAGGGGGGGYLGGLGGGNQGGGYYTTGGSGGQNLGDYTEAGNGTTVGGTSSPYFPTTGNGIPVQYIGNAGYPGYLIMVFNRKFGVNIKEANTWIETSAVYAKISELDYTTTYTQETATYSTAGTSLFTVPEGVTSLTVTVTGAEGGGAGSAGTTVTQTIQVTQGTTIPITVGAGGGPSGKFTTYYSGSIAPYSNGQAYDDLHDRYTAAYIPGSFIGTRDVVDNYFQITLNPGWAMYAAGAEGFDWPAPYVVATAGNGDVAFSIGKTVAGVNGYGGATQGNGGSTFTIYQPLPATAGGSSSVGSIIAAGGTAGSTLNTGSDGSVTINYAQPHRVSSWRPVQNMWLKKNNVWTSVISNNTIQAALSQVITYTDLVTHTFTVPAGVTTVNCQLVGGGGGGGGTDYPYGGYDGYPGEILYGQISVTSGDVLTISVGSGGAVGSAGTGSGGGIPGGISSLGFNGGVGGNAGGTGWSGGGGGGGAASVIEKNGTIIAVAAGGAGGGGGGNHSYGRPTQGYSNSGAYYGGAGTNKSGDGGGAGGGGGGFFGGAGGATYGGDDGAYSGSNGASLVPGGWTASSATNGGTGEPYGGTGTAGGNGVIVISYY